MIHGSKRCCVDLEQVGRAHYAHVMCCPESLGEPALEHLGTMYDRRFVSVTALLLRESSQHIYAVYDSNLDFRPRTPSNCDRGPKR